MSDDMPGESRPRVGPGVEAALSAEERAEEPALEEFARRTDWAAWSAASAPSGFAQRVMLHGQRAPEPAPERRRETWALRLLARGRRRPRTIGAALLLAALSLAVLIGVGSFLGRGAVEGRQRAEVRTELAIGARAIAVLEAGAELSWRGERVEQRRGRVFYRVNPGGEFRVGTPDGAVEVVGTCFGVEVGERSADGGGATRVEVLEGRVLVSAGLARAELRAGESARLGRDGVQVSARDGARAAPGPNGVIGGAAAQRPPTGPAGAAPADPVEAVAALRRQLERVEEEKRSLEGALRAAEAGLRQLRDEPPPRHPFELTPEDWRELARDGTVKFRVPCSTPDWKVSPEALDALGLAPEDAALLEAAYARSRERLWQVLRPLCVEALGSETVPEILGRTGCINGILAAERQRDRAAADEAMHEVAEIRAGGRPAPEPSMANDPVLRALLALTAEPARFEAELAEAFGPEEARRLAYSDALCRTELHFAGPGPRKTTGN
jgi:FecR-like protein